MVTTRLYVRGRNIPWLVKGTADQVLEQLRDVGEEPMPYVELEAVHGETLRVNPFAVDALMEVVE